mmetsp:Transcript_2184/g.2246  ORF Transcript_2184/g.2246 Transcript_2184/m.2246 type:complete len:198 (-) Transcript_2184:56-649(-)
MSYPTITKFIIYSLLFLTVFQFTTPTPSKYQRITYLQHVPGFRSNDADGAEYHQLEIVWSSSVIPVKPDSEEWKYFILRDDENDVSDFSNHKTYLNDRYPRFFIEYGGEHCSLSFLAWDVTPSCSSGVTTVTFKMKYFNCDADATAYKATLSTTTTLIMGNKLGPFSENANDITYEGTPVNSDTFLRGTDATLALCT